jgi:RNA polymerase primary sigma factor
MVKRTEPVKHAVIKAKDVVVKHAQLKRPDAKKTMLLERAGKKAKIVDLTARPVRPEPAAKAPDPKERPGRKPKSTEDQVLGSDAADALPEAGDDAVDPAVQVAEKLTPKQRAKDRRAKEKALKEALERSYHGTEEDLEARRNKLKALIKLGKERGFLTYAEINDHLPDNLVDAEAIDSIISTFGDMGI